MPFPEKTLVPSKMAGVQMKQGGLDRSADSRRIARRPDPPACNHLNTDYIFNKINKLLNIFERPQPAAIRLSAALPGR